MGMAVSAERSGRLRPNWKESEMSVVDGMRERVVERYRSQIGRGRHEVTTPALLLDLDVARRNLAGMAMKFDQMPAKLRPHIKVHKCVELSLMMVDAGAVGSHVRLRGRRW